LENWDQAIIYSLKITRLVDWIHISFIDRSKNIEQMIS